MGAHSLMLYLYLASNADGYCLALSPVAVRQAIGMARSTYHDQFHRLVDKGYLVPSKGNTFEFYEVPQAAAQTKKDVSADGLNFEDAPSDGELENPDGFSVLSEDTSTLISTQGTEIPLSARFLIVAAELYLWKGPFLSERSLSRTL